MASIANAPPPAPAPSAPCSPSSVRLPGSPRSLSFHPPGPHGVLNTRFAVLGAGFAGVSVAWHLLQHTSSSGPVSVDLFDEAGIGGGASGVSGGLLHPYTPKGKLLWKGSEGWQAALSLLSVAEAAALSKPIAWRRGILRPLVTEKHIKDARKLGCGDGIQRLERPLAQVMMPGLELPESGLGLYIPGGINLHPRAYLEALWSACEEFAHTAGGGTRAALVNQRVSSLAEVSREGYEAVVVCAGSKAVLLPELAGKLPLSMCRGVVAHLELPFEYAEYDSHAPNLLTHTWLAVQGAREMVLGATKDWSSGAECGAVSAEEGALVHDELVRRAAEFYPLIKRWQVKSLRAGVRAMPPRTPLGALPLAGCVNKLVEPLQSETQWWLIGGLGSRGLIYHGWLGECVAGAMAAGDASLIPRELNQFGAALAQV